MEIVQDLSCDYSIALSCQNDNRKKETIQNQIETKNQMSGIPLFYLFLGGCDPKIFHSEAQVVRH